MTTDDTIPTDVEVIHANLAVVLERLDSTWEYARIAFGDHHPATREILDARHATVHAIGALGQRTTHD